jgi:hypothetical protein
VIINRFAQIAAEHFNQSQGISDLTAHAQIRGWSNDKTWTNFATAVIQLAL